MPTAFKSARTALRPALTAALTAWLDAKEVSAAAEGTAAGNYYAGLYGETQVVKDEDSPAGPPAIRLQPPTEATLQRSKSDLHAELTVTVRITGETSSALDLLAGALRERLGMTLDRSHRIGIDGFEVVHQDADMPDNPLSEPTPEGEVIYGLMQRYRFLVRPA